MAEFKLSYTANEINNKLANIPEIDTSLSVRGEAADAKAVGDALSQKQPVGNYATESYVNTAINAIPTPDVSGQINTHNASSSSHADIREQLSDKADKIHGNHVPSIETTNNAKFLRNDNTWQTVTPANIGASDIDHKHTKSEITDFPTSMTPTAHNQGANTITAGTFAGSVMANSTSTASLGTAQVRNIYAGTSDLTPGSSPLTTGTLYFLYE